MMTKFIKKTVLFLILPLCLGLTLDIVISNQLKKIKDFPCENEVWNDIYSSHINAEIAILGSSRAWVHFNPKIIDSLLNSKSYNFGEDGSNILQQYIRYKEYIKFNLHPKLVIISVDMWSLKNHFNQYPTTKYYPYMLGNFRVYEILKKFNKEEYNKNNFFIPILRYLNISQLKLILNNPKIPYSKTFNKSFELNNEGKFRYNGFRGMDLHWDSGDVPFDQVKDYSVNIDSTSVQVMELFIEELQQDKIKVIMVYSPEYKEGQFITKNRNEVFSIFEKVSNKFNLPFFDYSDSLISERKELFYNVQHLNKNGATVFTMQFIKDLKARTHNMRYKKLPER